MEFSLGQDVIFMITGLLLVFLILILLAVLIWLEGKFFDARDLRRKGNAGTALSSGGAQASAPAGGHAAAAAPAPAPAVQQGIPAEIVAAIAAAIAAMSGGRYVLRAVRRADGDVRGNWGKAGVTDVTSPF